MTQDVAAVATGLMGVQVGPDAAAGGMAPGMEEPFPAALPAALPTAFPAAMDIVTATGPGGAGAAAGMGGVAMEMCAAEVTGGTEATEEVTLQPAAVMEGPSAAAAEQAEKTMLEEEEEGGEAQGHIET